MTRSGLALLEPRNSKAEDFFGLQLLDVQRWTELAREAVHGSKAGYVFTLPSVSVRQTYTTGAQMCGEKVIGFASAMELVADDALAQALEMVRLRFNRPHGIVFEARVELEDRGAAFHVPDWVANLDSGSEVGDVAKTIDALFSDARDRGLDAVNQTLQAIDVTQANHIHLVAVLRALFRSRQRLSNWRQLRDRTFDEILRRKKNAHRIMAGLDVD